MDPNSEFTGMIKQGFSIMRVENDTQQQISVLRPRDEKKVLEKAIAELEDTPEFAKKAFYSIPYNSKQPDGSKKTVWVEGISIGGSMAIARRWGNAADANRVVGEEQDYIVCEGVFMDYETNVRHMRQVRVARSYYSSGKMLPYRADKLSIAIQSGLSKAVRNAVLHGIPDSIKIQYLAQAKKISKMVKTEKGLVEIPLKQRLERLFSDFTAQGVTKAEIVKFLGKSTVTESEYDNLCGILNALEEGHVKKESIFEVEKPASEPVNPVNLEDVIS